MKRAIIIGATSGIGKEVARILVAQGWKVGVAGRRTTLLLQMHDDAPAQITIQTLDVTNENATQKLYDLIDRTGGMDVFVLCAGIGSQNPDLSVGIEMCTVATNVAGFVQMTNAAFNYYREKQNQPGHIVVISSIAGTMGLGAAPAYSASKRFQNTYIDALEQLAYMKHLPIRFTDIRPGFVDTNLLQGGKYPLLMHPERVARRIVRAITQQERVVIIDWRYRIIVQLWRLIPRWLWKRLPIHT